MYEGVYEGSYTGEVTTNQQLETNTECRGHLHLIKPNLSNRQYLKLIILLVHCAHCEVYDKDRKHDEAFLRGIIYLK